MTDTRPRRIPPEIHARLVATLYTTTGSFLAGIVGALIVPFITYWRTGNPIFFACEAILIGCSAFRLVVFIAYRRSSPDQQIAEARLWEMLYAIGAIIFMTVAGSTIAILQLVEGDTLATLYGVVGVLALAGALASRNAARPFIVYAQVIGVLAPITTIFLFSDDVAYRCLGTLLLLVPASVWSTTRSLNKQLVNALLDERDASRQRARFNAAIENMSHALVMADPSGSINVANDKLCDLFNIKVQPTMTATSLAQAIAQSCETDEASRARFLAVWNDQIRTEQSADFNAKLGSRYFQFKREAMDDGGFVIIAADVTDAHVAAQEIERAAHFDVLTKLPNRLLFQKRLDSALAAQQGNSNQTILLSFDLNGFKQVNDAYGHAAGDQLLREVANRLLRAIRPSDLAARFGGDEFAALLIDSSSQSLEATCRRLAGVLSQPYNLDNKIIYIGVSIGAACAPEDGRTSDALMRAADLALYAAKTDTQTSWRIYNPELENAVQRKRAIEIDLQRALTTSELEIHYQPIIDLKTHRIKCLEALMRWNHPTKGRISPGNFIPIAEETGLIIALGELALNQACRDAAQWPNNIRVAVNVSTLQFHRGDIVRTVAKALAETNLAPERLELEITETVILRDTDATLTTLTELCRLGVRLALDDFGTGYSSLSYINRFPFHKIKIDRAFVQDLANTKSQAVVGAITHLTKTLGIDVVAEGVETVDQILTLATHNVPEIQGYYFSRPMPVSELGPLLKQTFDSPLLTAGYDSRSWARVKAKEPKAPTWPPNQLLRAKDTVQ